MKRQIVAIVGLFVAWQISAAVQTKAPPEVERPFAKGGRLFMDLSAGDYTIRGAMEDRIRVRWEARDLKNVEAEVEVKGSEATIRVRGPKNNFSVQIDVPSRSDLTMNLTAGDLTVKGVEGSKTLDMWAGDVTIEVGDTALYRRVEASVRFGEITAAPFGAHKGGIFRSFTWDGHGKHSIGAKLFAGDLKLVK